MYEKDKNSTMYVYYNNDISKMLIYEFKLFILVRMALRAPYSNIQSLYCRIAMGGFLLN